jgi:hypothetical protein
MDGKEGELVKAGSGQSLRVTGQSSTMRNRPAVIGHLLSLTPRFEIKTHFLSF